MRVFLIFLFLTATASAQEMQATPSVLAGIPDPNQPVFVENDETQAGLETEKKASSLQATAEILRKLQNNQRALASESK